MKKRASELRVYFIVVNLILSVVSFSFLVGGAFAQQDNTAAKVQEGLSMTMSLSQLYNMVQKQETILPVIAAILIFITAVFWCLGFTVLFFAILYAAAFVIPFIVVPILLVPLMVIFITIFGGISALQRKRWGLVLTASIIATLPFNLLGLIALVLIVLSKNEFD